MILFLSHAKLALALSILLLAASTSSNVRADLLFAGARPSDRIIAALQATGRLSAPLDTFDVSAGTPTLEMLLQYDAVLVLSDFHFDDSVLLGDRLADYVDAGGGVVVTPFLFRDDPNLALQGRWASGGYNPIPITGGEHQGTWSLGQVHQPGHPVLDGAAGILFSSSFTTDAPVAAGFELIAEWLRGNNAPIVPLVAESTVFSGRVVLFNAFPEPAHLNAAGFNLLANSINYAAVPEPSAMLLVLVSGSGLVIRRRRSCGRT